MVKGPAREAVAVSSSFMRNLRLTRWEGAPVIGFRDLPPFNHVASSTTPIADMAIGDDTREIPDSGDEPMTSSPVVPVNVSDGRADKLSVTTSAPHQAPQDAPQEANSSPQDAVEPGCSLFPDSVRCLHVDRNIASLNVEPPNSEFDHVLSRNSLSQGGANTIMSSEHEQIKIPTSQNLELQISETALNNEKLVPQNHRTSSLSMEASEEQCTSKIDRTLSFQINRENQCSSPSAHKLVDVVGEMSSRSDPLLSIHHTSKQQDNTIDVDVKMADVDGPHDKHIVEDSGVCLHQVFNLFYLLTILRTNLLDYYLHVLTKAVCSQSHRTMLLALLLGLG